MKDGKLEVGDVLRDWSVGVRQVVSVLRPEHLHRFTDGLSNYYRGSNAERCALHGGSTRPHNLGVRD